MTLLNPIRLATGLAASFLLLPVSALAENTPFKWPNGARAAVNLAYDDALDSQLDYAIPTLNKYKLKGSFYIPVAAQSMNGRLDEWRIVAKQGHELGNHSIFHQCSKSKPERSWVSDDNDLDKMSAAQMQDQVKVSNRFLYALDGKSERTYTPPCIDFEAGGQNYINGLKNDFVAIKGIGTGVTPSMVGLDPYNVGVSFPNNVSGEQLIAMVNEAVEKGTMVNFTFHGVGGDHLAVSREAHEQLIKYLAANKKIIWTDSFLSIMKYVKTQQSAKNALKK